MAVLSLYDELRALITALNAHEAPYAVCGGVALAVFGEPRATKDIDLLVRPGDVEQLRLVLKGAGYSLEAAPMAFSSGVEVRRISKVVEGELFTVDLVLAEGALADVFATRQVVTWGDQDLWIVSRDGLIAMKRLADRAQDRADIERLGGTADEDAG